MTYVVVAPYTQLYRDCLRLIQHVAPGKTSGKAIALRTTVRNEFAKHRHETDEAKIEAYKANAVRALANYLLATQAVSDPQMKPAADEYYGRSVQDAKSEKEKNLSGESRDGVK